MATQEEINALKAQLKVLMDAHEASKLHPAAIRDQFKYVLAYGGIPGPAINVNNFELKS